ncbi:MAG: sigma-70 family RNA polymerase sigma factor [Bacteroides sp.]|nr:hypothetical protein [Roseburia sp.]MCM1346727.1 sigma-70 family RNA polymerase sigma factor [Bacteroides sp.]MCM1421293.1 sigma-70 family RNA polymerase sigma factor [Bacteroides sp.]
MSSMSDREIVRALIERNRFVTRQFFYVNCRPLFTSIIHRVFDYPVEYDEFVNELYGMLMENDARKLRMFDFRSSVYQWIKTVAIRHFMYKKDEMIDNTSKQPLSNIQPTESDNVGATGKPENYMDAESEIAARIDFENILARMTNKRYADVIRKLTIEDTEPKKLAAEMGVTIENLYNIKKRAMAAFTNIVLGDIKKYNNKEGR